MTTASVISGVSVAHQHADLDAIDAAAAEDARTLVADLLAVPEVDEAFALQTCNRVEAYVVTDDEADGRTALAGVVADVPAEGVVPMDHETSLRHLMRVACGLESLVVGEDQILGQFRDAYLASRAAGGVGPVLEEALTKAIHVGERARTETAINEGVVSLGSAAVRLAETDLDALDDATALVVGTGEMGTLAARSLADRVAHVVVANRTLATAEHVARTLDGVESSAVGLGALSPALEAADVVVSATGAPTTVIDAGHLSTAGETYLVDLARPRDVDAGVESLADVTVVDLDTLEDVTDATAERRAVAAREVEAMIDREFENLLAQYKRKRADEAIGAMYEGAERIKTREVGKALSRLDAAESDEERHEVVESLADALVGQLLAAPTKSLRDAAERDDWSTIHTALRLFDPSEDAGAVPPIPANAAEDIPESVRDGMPNAVLEQLDD
ncbi:glutamyl-tRNA reductase [Halomarina oriensis]|uniref:Glutamyl-tRNA reductase n=1 Tax=Halomarina oriensis TaxID=671145 RepID=A0A6B0GN51_9EURY|nr:glutamyl-tRNA reductase [Halomarina oriensis]